MDDEPNKHDLRASISRGVWLPVILFVATLAVYIPTIAHGQLSSDASASAVSAWRIATTGRPWMEGVDTDALGEAVQLTWIVPGSGDHLVHNRFAATVLVAVPFYLIRGGSTDPQDFSLVPGGLAAATLTAGTVLLIFLTVRRYVHRALALCGALVLGFATPTWSVSADGVWGHSVTQFALAGAAWSLSRNRWLATGVWLGLGVLARPHLTVIAALVGLGMGWSRRDKWVAVKVALPIAGALALLLTWNRLVFGVWNVQGGYGGYVIDNLDRRVSGAGGELINFLGFFVSPDRGMFVWTPLLVLLLPSMIRSWRRLPDWSRWIVIAGFAYTLVQLRLNRFTGGDGFHGYRHGLELVTCLWPALVISFERVGRGARLLVAPLIGIQFAMVTVGASRESSLYWVPEADVWNDNSFLVAFRYSPLAIGLLALTFLLAGVATSIWWSRRSNTLRIEPEIVKRC